MGAQETPATRAARAAGIAFTLHEYTHDPGVGAFGLEAADKLGVDPARVLKTLVVLRAGALCVAIIPAEAQLRLRALGKHAEMAPRARAEAATGYVRGGISPLGQRRRLVTLIEVAVLGHPTVFVSAGRRGLELELDPADLVALTEATALSLS